VVRPQAAAPLSENPGDPGKVIAIRMGNLDIILLKIIVHLNNLLNH
jgi:hypothetical protein